MKFKPHPILPELVALLDKHKASISYTRMDDGIHVHVDGNSNDIGLEVFSGWACQDFGLDDLREAAAGCLAPEAALLDAMTGMKEEDRMAIFTRLRDRFCSQCGSSSGWSCNCTRDE